MIKSIKIEAEYEAALKKLHAYIRRGYVGNTPEAAEMHNLADSIEAYEDVHFPIS